MNIVLSNIKDAKVEDRIWQDGMTEYIGKVIAIDGNKYRLKFGIHEFDLDNSK